MIEWYMVDIERLVQANVFSIAARARAVMRSRVSFPLGQDGNAITVGEEGMVAEYGTANKAGTPWVFDGLRSIVDGGHA